MTESSPTPQERAEGPRCRWCRHALAPKTGPGRPAEFCSQKCRQWDWVSRQRAADLELSENELIMTRDELDLLKDQIFVLHCALLDVKTDMKSDKHTKQSLTEMLVWLIEAAEPVALTSLSPSLRP